MAPEHDRNHPIDPSLLELGPSGEPTATDGFEAMLARVQSRLEADLPELHREAIAGSDRIAAWDTASIAGIEAYLFLGRFEEYWGDVFDAIALDDPSTREAIRLVHARQAEQWTRVADEEALVVGTPRDWAHGYSAARQELLALLAAELSGAEAIDLWFLAFGFVAESQTRQGHRRGVSPQAVHNNVQQAVAKLADHPSTPLSVLRRRN